MKLNKTIKAFFIANLFSGLLCTKMFCMNTKYIRVIEDIEDIDCYCSQYGQNTENHNFGKSRKRKRDNKIKKEVSESQNKSHKKSRKLNNIFCAMCKKEIQYENQLEEYKCGHCLHKACIIKALQKMGRCSRCTKVSKLENKESYCNNQNQNTGIKDFDSDLNYSSFNYRDQIPVWRQEEFKYISDKEIFKIFQKHELLKMLNPKYPCTLD